MTNYSIIPESYFLVLDEDPFGSQRQVQTATLEDGRQIAVWAELDSRTDRYDIMACYLGENGEVEGQAFLINSTTKSDQIKPHALALKGGGFTVTWQSYGQDSFIVPEPFKTSSGFYTQYGIYQQVFDEHGLPAGAETLVNTLVDGKQADAVMVPLQDGGYVTIWQHWNFLSAEGRGEMTFFQRFDADGNPVGGNIEMPAIAEIPGYGERPPFITPSAVELPDGSLAVSWHASPYGLHYLTTMTLDGDLVSQTRIGEIEYSSELQLLEDGNLLVLWGQEGALSSHVNIHAAVYGPDGTEITAPFQLNTEAHSNKIPLQLLDLGDGRTLAIWWDQTEGAVKGRVITPRGSVSKELFLTPEATSEAEVCAVLLPDGRVQITWESKLFEDSALGSEIYSRTLSLEALDDIARLGSGSGEHLLSEIGDTVDAQAGDDLLQGLAGDDLIWGGEGRDTLYGGAGDDQLMGGTNADTVSGGEGADFIYGDAGNDVLLGGAHDDQLFGGRGSDSLQGGGGADVLFGGLGSDTLQGGRGNDLIVSSPTSANSHRIGTNLVFGGGGNDTIKVQGTDNTVYGGNGNDVIVSGAFGHISSQGELHGGAGNDYITARAEVAFGGTGDDLIDTGSWQAGVHGGKGQDTLIAEGLIDLMRGKVGHYRFQQIEYTGEISGIEVFSFTTSDGGPPSSHFYGDSKANVVLFSSGYLRAYGGGGDDYIACLESRFDSRYTASLSGATVDGGAGNDTLLGGGARDWIAGGRGDDLIRGGDLRDSLAGGAGDDTLEGNSGADTIDGGRGNNFLRGGAGADVFVFKRIFGSNQIEDYEVGLDKIDIRALSGRHSSLVFDLSGETVEVDGGGKGGTLIIRIRDGEEGSELFLNNDSSGDEQVAMLTGVSAGDFGVTDFLF